MYRKKSNVKSQTSRNLGLSHLKQHYHATDKAMKHSTGALTIQDIFSREAVANMVQEKVHQVFATTQDHQINDKISNVEN